jgi:hypothetical protein
MDDTVKKAFEISNFMSALAEQKRVLLEEYHQNSIYFFNGTVFKVDKELINFVKTLIDLGQDSFVLIDNNNTPVDIQNPKKFLQELLDKYFFAANAYNTKFQKLKSSRSVESLLDI